jgi:predicted DNA-binding mobile mystery protein A
MQKELRRRARRDLEDAIRVFRSSDVRRSRWGWVRGVRQAVGMPVAEMARRMKVGTSEIFRLEVAEQRDAITLKKLRAAAQALGCELVYAVVPMKGTLEELAREVEREQRRRSDERPQRGPKADPYNLLKTVKSLLALTGWYQGRGKQRKKLRKTA